VLKFDLDAIHRSIIQTDGASPADISRCSLSSLTARCLGSIVVSVIGTLILLAVLRGSRKTFAGK
jgi:hypothetical protein